MGSLLATAVGLGIAGIDPAGALIAVAALAAGARDRVVLLFGVIVVLGTALLGTALSLTLGGNLADIDWSGLAPTGSTFAALELAIGTALLIWGTVRLRAGAHPPKPRRPRTGTAGLLGAGALLAASAPLDPTFVALTVLAGRGQEPVGVLLAHLLWILISQAPLVLLLVAVARGGHQRVVDRFQTWWARVQPALRRLVTGAVLLVGMICVIDAVWWFATEDFLLPSG